MIPTYDLSIAHEKFFSNAWTDSNTSSQAVYTQVVFDTYNMSYSKRTITLKYKVYASLGTETDAYRVYQNYAVKIYPAYSSGSKYSVYDEITLYSTSSLTLKGTDDYLLTEGTVEVPYPNSENGLMFYYGASGVRNGVTYKCGTYYTHNDFTIAPSHAFRELVDYPFYLDFPYETFTRDMSVVQEERVNKGIYNTTVGNYSIIVPAAGYPQYAIRVHDADATRTIYEYVMTNPGEGRYDVEFRIDAEGAQALREAMLASGSTKDYYVAYFWESFTNLGGITTSNSKKFYIVFSNTTPVVSGTVIDTNSVAIAVSGDANTMIRWLSHIEASITVEAQGGATIVEYGIMNGGHDRQFVNTTVFEATGDEVFQFYATDNRGETGYATITMPVIEYLQPTAKVNTGVITGEGEAAVTVKGVYFASNINTTANTIAVAYRYKLNGAEDTEYSDWAQITEIEVDAETNTYVASGYATGLDYNKTYEFQAKIVDVFYTALSAIYVAASIPVFDWSATDFNFNVPVTVMGKPLGGTPENKVLWSGKQSMTAGTSINLSEAISAQEHGVVIVFSTGGGDNGWNTFFIPKIMVSLYNGGAQTFFLASGGTAVGINQLFIEDKSISGAMGNNEDGNSPATNITVSSSLFALRYVIGV